VTQSASKPDASLPTDVILPKAINQQHNPSITVRRHGCLLSSQSKPVLHILNYMLHHLYLVLMVAVNQYCNYEIELMNFS
jgi:hypothetical protein